MTWKPTLFSELAEFRNGLNFVKNDNGRTIKIIGVSDFKDYIELESLDTLEQIKIKGNLKSEDLLQDDDLLFVRSNGNKKLIGRCMIIKVGKQEISYSGFTIRARLKSKEVLPRFLVQLFRSAYIKDQIQTVGGGTNISNLSQSILGDLKIPLPPLLEQCRIAEVLGVWDESIDLLERLIGRVRSRKQGLMQQLLTGKKRFKEFEGSDDRQKTLYGSLPSDWKYIPIADIAQEYSTKNKEASDLTVLSCSKYKGLVNSLDYFGKQIFSEDTSTYKIVKYGMFAYATNHIDEGSIGYQNLCDKALISPMYTVFKTDSNRVHDLFLYSVLKTEYYRQIFSINTSASVERRGSLRWKDFSKIKVPLPSLPEQEKIAAVLSAADEEISTLEKQLAAYKQQKLGLMQQLLTGKIRVGMIEGSVGAGLC
jgi:type I restriction enzyme, S subunit